MQQKWTNSRSLHLGLARFYNSPERAVQHWERVLDGEQHAAEAIAPLRQHYEMITGKGSGLLTLLLREAQLSEDAERMQELFTGFRAGSVPQGSPNAGENSDFEVFALSADPEAIAPTLGELSLIEQLSEFFWECGCRYSALEFFIMDSKAGRMFV